MAKITLQGRPISTSGQLPAVGSRVPDFVLTRGDLEDVRLSDFAGRRAVVSIVPSLDTGVCAASARRFNKEAAGIGDAVVLTVSADLPFAQKRFCEAEGIDRVVTLSELRSRDFGRDWGVRIVDGPFAGLLARAVVVIDEKGVVLHAEQVPEIAQEPDYARALAALRG